MFELIGALFVSFAAFMVYNVKSHINHERRLTRMETKFDLLLTKNGIDPKGCDQGRK